jgi:hypothetical protein
MGCPAFSKATAASLTVSAAFASEARTTSQHTLYSIVGILFVETLLELCLFGCGTLFV